MSRVLDERGRIFGKVNVVDVLVLLAVVALIVFTVVRTQGSGATTVPAQVTFEVAQVDQATASILLTAHGTLRDDSARILGTIVKVTAQPSQEEVLNPLTGQSETVLSTLYQDVYVVVGARVAGPSYAYRIGSASVQTGDKVVIVGSPNFKQPSTVWKVVRE